MTLRPVHKTNRLLADLSTGQLKLLESLSREVEVLDDTTLFEEGGEADTFYIITDGKVALEMTSPGKHPMVIETLGPGDLVGVSWLFPPYRWNWRARSLGDTILVAFDAIEMRRHCQEDHDLALKVVKAISAEVARRLQSTRIRLLDLYQ